jgi:hypothetical protein
VCGVVAEDARDGVYDHENSTQVQCFGWRAEGTGLMQGLGLTCASPCSSGLRLPCTDGLKLVENLVRGCLENLVLVRMDIILGCIDQIVLGYVLRPVSCPWTCVYALACLASMPPSSPPPPSCLHPRVALPLSALI